MDDIYQRGFATEKPTGTGIFESGFKLGSMCPGIYRCGCGRRQPVRDWRKLNVRKYFFVNIV